MPPAVPAVPAVPAAVPALVLPAEVEPALAALITKIAGPIATQAAEAALASRPNNPMPSAPAITGKDMQLDVPTSEQRYAWIGYQVKSAYLEAAERRGKGKEEKFAKLRKYVERVKSTGIFNTVLNQGGIWARETQSTDTSLIEVLRSEAVLLKAGAMTLTDYGSRITIGKLDSGVTVYWLAEGEPVTKSDARTALISLGAHEFGALAPISNAVLQLGGMDASAIIGREMAAAIAAEVDLVGIKGSGAKKPQGYRGQTADNGNVEAISGTATTNKIDDLDDLVEQVDSGNLPGGIGEVNSPCYLMDKDIMYSLRRLRDNAGWVFPELRDLKNPMINGFPVFTPTSVAGDNRIDFFLAKYLMMGEAAATQYTLGEADGDFASNMVSMRAIGFVDWLVRRTQAFASKTTVTYP
jgi:HK97 family phage major capsid protein